MRGRRACRAALALLLGAGCSSQRALPAAGDGGSNSDAAVDAAHAPDAASNWIWERAASPPASATESSYVTDVIAGGPGFVAVGNAFTPDPGFRWQAAVWLSTDGRAWERLAPQAAFADSHLSAVARGPSGMIVAVGSTGDPLAGVPAAWSSADGKHWSRVPLAGDAAPGGNMRDVAAVGTVFVAVGDTHEGPLDPLATAAAVWLLADGARWEPLTPQPAGGGLGQLVSTSRGLFAVGQERVASGASVAFRSVLWASADGHAWRRAIGIDDPLAHYVFDLVETSAGLLALGVENGVLGQTATAWLSQDGSTWSRLALGEIFAVDPPHRSGFAGLIAVGAEVVATGSMHYTPRNPVSHELADCGSGYAAFWRSRDSGRSWSRVVHDPAVFGAAGETATSARSLAHQGSTLVAAGSRCLGSFADGRGHIAPVFWRATPWP